VIWNLVSIALIKVELSLDSIFNQIVLSQAEIENIDVDYTGFNLSGSL